MLLMATCNSTNHEKKIKVGIDTRDLRISKTGALTYLEELCKQFRKNDPDFIFIFIDTLIPVYTGKNKFGKLLEHIRFFLWKQFQLPVIAFVRSCDIVFCTDYFVPYFHPGCVTVPVFHDAFFWEYPEQYNPYWLFLFRVFGVGAAKRAACIITPTLYAKKQIVAFSGLPANSIIPVYEAPKTLSGPAKKNNGVADQVAPELSFPYILHVGTFEKRKNLSVLINAFGELIKNDHNKLKLILIGQSSPKKTIDDSEHLFELIKQKKLENHVIMPGYISDEMLPYYYQHALLYVFPSRNEGFGIPVLEAFSYRLPVLISNNSCLPEIAGDAAISFDPDNAGDLCNQINRLLNNQELRQALAEKGIQRLQFFSWEKAAAELKDIFRRSLSTKEL
jgi:glycosyltransferase involved in cell wall biosynthesis